MNGKKLSDTLMPPEFLELDEITPADFLDSETAVAEGEKRVGILDNEEMAVYTLIRRFEIAQRGLIEKMGGEDKAEAYELMKAADEYFILIHTLYGHLYLRIHRRLHYSPQRLQIRKGFTIVEAPRGTLVIIARKKDSTPWEDDIFNLTPQGEA